MRVEALDFPDGTRQTTSPGGESSIQAPEWMRNYADPVDTPAWADNFNSDTLANYTQIVPSGTMDVAIGRDVASFKFDGQSNNDMACMVQALPVLTKPWALEASYRVWLGARSNYIMAGPVLMDGDAATSSALWWMPYWGDTSFRMSLRQGTPEHIGTDHGSFDRYPYGETGDRPATVRMVVNADDTVTIERTIDGVQWSGSPSSSHHDVNHGLTLSHFGFGVSTWGGSSAIWSRLVSLDYLRLYEL